LAEKIVCIFKVLKIKYLMQQTIRITASAI